MTDAEHQNSTYFGQPIQMLNAKVTDCVFENVPYHINDELMASQGPRHVK